MGHPSKGGRILTLIGAILTVISVLAAIGLGVYAFFDEQEQDPLIIFLIFLGIAIYFLIFAVIKFYAVNKMKVAETTKKGGVYALVGGILSLDLFSFIGGILGIVAGGKATPQSVQTSPQAGQPMESAAAPVSHPPQPTAQAPPRVSVPSLPAQPAGDAPAKK